MIHCSLYEYPAAAEPARSFTQVFDATLPLSTFDFPRDASLVTTHHDKNPPCHHRNDLVRSLT